MPATRLSATAESHVVQPRFEPPVTTNRSIFWLCFWSRDFLQGVHRPDGALDHREEQRPRGVLGFEIPQKRFADEIVFLAVAQQRLVGNLAQKRDGHLRGGGQLAAHGPVVVAELAARAAAHDEQQDRVVVADIAHGNEHGQRVLPSDSLPHLRRQIDVVRQEVVAAIVLEKLPGKRIILGRDVILQGRGNAVGRRFFRVRARMTNCHDHRDKKQMG